MGKEKIFEDTLTKKYRHEDFCRFALEFFSGMNVIAPDLPQKPASNFSGHVKEFYFIGNYQSGGEKIIVLAVNLNKDKSVDRARSVQRNFVKSIMGNDADGACAAFYSDAAPDKWRLSFLKIDYVLLESKVDVTITPAKRCSYLVGENEPCNTAYQQLYKIFADDSKLPSLEELAEAFSVERVTQEFFEIYKTKYNQVCELLKNNSAFLNKKFTAEQFAKKLLGQIVFLYFLQKKGWLGVDKDSEWGSGQVKFMRKIFDEAVRDGKNFFNEVLEPLFYNALNCERPDDFYQPLNTRIPFLNGGLFEELDGYDWRGNVLSLGNEIFSNAADDGILDIFDRYNFTINEDAPHEREVAVDPEMLGKIFENLLENNDRTAKGAFYTPREIVHYMCREALINYLIERTKIPEKAVRDFILHGDFLKDEDAANFKAGKKLFIDAQIFNRLAEIDNLLAEIKVADPAVGSGAFPLGMLNEIVTAREVLTVYMSLAANFQAEGRALYDLKLNTIKNSIFACDIEPSAVDIAKLRLWLSIVIDDVPKDKNFTPHRLPNLDCNIICGNSLVDEFNGVDLLSVQGDIFYDNAARISDRKSLVKLQHELFDETKPALKKILRKKIRDIYDKIVEKNLKDAALIENYREAAREKSLPFVLWQLYFPTVFEDGGFDIVIGNPPYGAKISDADKKFFKKKFLCTKTISGKQKGSTDTFALFIEHAFNLCKRNGFVSLIVPMSVISSDSITALHNLLEKNCRVIQVSSYSCRPKQIFSAACVNTSVISFQKTLTPVEKIFTSKLMRRNEKYTLKDLMNDLTFIESKNLKLPGRYPKIGNEIQKNILSKIFHAPKHLSDYSDERGKPFYYRTSGGRYFNVITDYSTNSSKENSYYVTKKFTRIISATLNTSLFWFYQQAYMNGLDIKRFELEMFPLFDLEKLTPAQIELIEKIYDKYLIDIEKNATIRRVGENSSYNLETFKMYKLGQSKHLADALDDIIGELYGLSAEEIEYIKNFELEFRLSD